MTPEELKANSVLELPRIIKVLGKSFKIRILTPEEETDSEGMMTLDKQEIAIRPQEAIEQVQDTALHETIHAVDESLYLRMTETQVHKLATGLLAVLKDNPEYARWLLKENV
jgi:hypothetical protein